MSIEELIIIGLSLAMDASAIAAGNGITYQGGARAAVITSLSFGIAQALMSLIGYWAGLSFAGFISAIDHWLAFILLGIIGGKMLADGVRELKTHSEKPSHKILSVKILLLQAIATSIDALVVGVTLAALQVNILEASTIIGLVTFSCCMLSSLLGSRLGRYVRKYAAILGGSLLIIIGAKTLIEHLAG